MNSRLKEFDGMNCIVRRVSIQQLCFIILILTEAVSASIRCGILQSCEQCNKVRNANDEQICEWCASSNRCVTYHFYSCFFGTKINDPNNCPMSIHQGDAYTDHFARTKMLAISAAAYWDNPQLCLTNQVDESAQVVCQVTVPCDSTNTTYCSAFTALSTNNHAIILGFRGTDTKHQLWVESFETVFDEMVDLNGGGQVSKYFYGAFYSVWNNGIRQSLLSLIASVNHDYDLWITGHSLGAAMASIASNVIATESLYKASSIKLVTFGQPRVGDQLFVDVHDKLILYSYRVVHARDMVPHLPPLDYRDYRHHRYEVWYDNDMAIGKPYEICLAPDSSCSDEDFLDLSMQDHRYYFQKDVSWWGKNGCQ